MRTVECYKVEEGDEKQEYNGVLEKDYIFQFLRICFWLLISK